MRKLRCLDADFFCMDTVRESFNGKYLLRYRRGLCAQEICPEIPRHTLATRKSTPRYRRIPCRPKIYTKILTSFILHSFNIPLLTNFTSSL